MMTSTRPPVRQAHSSHAHSHSTRTRSSLATPAVMPPQRAAASVAQAMPPSRTLRSPKKHTTTSTPHQQSPNRPSSPNYFGLIVDPAHDPRDTGVLPKDNWSPPTSSIHSFEKPSPQHLPLEFHPDLEAFRRQAESKTFSLGNLITSPTLQFPPSRKDSASLSPTHVNNAFPMGGFSQISERAGEDAMDLDSGERVGAAVADAPGFFDNSLGSAPNSFFQIQRHESPASFNAPSPRTDCAPRNALSSVDDRHPRLSLPNNRIDPPSPAKRGDSNHQRAETLPAALEEGPILITASHLKEIIACQPLSNYLLLDLRVFPQYSTSRIQDALNLCIPTTLLKRPSFNLQKLTDTFTNEQEKERFASWSKCEYIIVYDAFSSTKKDAVSAVNTLKKFTNEGWKGHSFILRGGFQEFARLYPKYVDQRSSSEMQSGKQNLSLGQTGPAVAPVAGGCAMPATKAPVNPFFSNIRQNTDLIGGVGQLELKRPKAYDAISQYLPPWLRKTSAEEDHGKLVADKFLHIELEEQSRLQKALSGQVTYGGNSNSDDKNSVQIAGIEKGSQNRYNNIWPFEHSRVKLKGRDSSCDYVNASHIKAARSNRRYIASQGPLPATFEDFWSVIWDNDVRVLVMLTAESEGGQLKCHPYWTAQDYGPYRLKALSEKKVSLDLTRSRHRHNSNPKAVDAIMGRRRANTSTEQANITPPVSSAAAEETPYVIVRKFTLAHAAHPFSPMREITQLHYSSWPDFGAPALPTHLLNLVELVDSVHRASASPLSNAKSDEPETDVDARPVLVHCSAGCGRTGTFCTVDSVIDMLKRQRREHRRNNDEMDVDGQSDNAPIAKDFLSDPDLDIVEMTVKDLRLQRISMVQSLRQYVLCYETVLEWMSHQLPARSSHGRSESDAGLLRFDAK